MKGSVVFSKDAPPPSLANATSSTATRPSSFVAGGNVRGVRNAKRGSVGGLDKAEGRYPSLPETPASRLAIPEGAGTNRVAGSRRTVASGRRAGLEARRRAAVDRADCDATVTGNARIEDAAIAVWGLLPLAFAGGRDAVPIEVARERGVSAVGTVTARIAGLDRRRTDPQIGDALLVHGNVAILSGVAQLGVSD